MNKERRNRLSAAIRLLDDASHIVKAVLEEESECMQNIPDNLQNGEKFEDMEDTVDDLETVLDEIESVTEKLGYILI